MTTQNQTLLEVHDLSVHYGYGADATHAVRNVEFRLARGEFVGLVGESGSGKSTLGFALTGLSKPPAHIEKGRILFGGKDIASLSPEQLREQRHGGIAMVLQSGMNALNPVRSIRNHFVDIFRAHGHVPHERWNDRALELAGKVELPATVLDRFPGELSGGMRQRVSIALALSLEPELMVFDEPTTALDVLVQHAVMNTIIELQRAENFTAILISHDLGIVLESAQRVMVMHEGRIVEDASAEEVLNNPQNEYTRMLLSHYADPRAEVVELPGFEDRAARAATGAKRASGATHPPTVSSRERRDDQKSIVVTNLSKVYPAPRRGEKPVRAVDDVSFTLEPGQSLALVGASGSGKSTIAKLITAVEKPTGGSVRFGDLDVGRLRRGQFRQLHRDVQMVFQDPYAALNPLHTVEYTLTRPVVNFTGLKGQDARRRVLELLDTVGLSPVEEFAAKLPHQLSGGQRQRVVIARALASNPQVIIADEPVSMLDVSIRLGVLTLLAELQRESNLGVLYITHDLATARHFSDRIMVLHHGRVVEHGTADDVILNPQHEYTRELQAASPDPEKHFATAPTSAQGGAA